MKYLGTIFLLIFTVSSALQAFSQLVAGGDTTICQGGQAQLTATGGGASYYWTSIPTDPSLLIPQTQNPVVSPQVSTMYVVQSNIATGNLILNGTFELGVMGFSSDYINNQSSIVQEGTYAVVADAHTVHPDFFCNEDHTTGSGMFMAVNGSGVPNVRVWYLDLPAIQPHHQYEFSTWITSLHPTNPAVLQFSINGVLMAEPFHAYSTTCDWYQFFYVWESDDNTTASISIVNQNTILSGNDFALDDISFATVVVHYDTVYVTVLPQYDSPFSLPDEACAQEVISVEYTGTAPDTAEYHWDFDGGTVISGAGPGPYDISYDLPGTYTISLFVTGEGCASDTTEHQVLIGESPVVEVSADATWIPYGTATTLHGSWSGGQGPFDFYWEPAGLVVDPLAMDPLTVDLTATTEFTFYVTDQSGQCTGFESITIQVTGGPLGLDVTATPDHVCPGESTTLNAITTGGTGNYSYAWSSDPPGFSSDLPSPTVMAEVTTTFFVTVDDGLSIAEGNIQVTVYDKPLADAGTDQTIPYGTTTVLEGSATGGSGEYNWHWTPESWLEDPYSQHPTTLGITEAVMFSLTVTDLQTGCVSTGDHVNVIPDGGPLGVTIQAASSEICAGDTCELMAIASGGNQGSYSYSWSDEYGNSYPQEASIIITPAMSTTYFVTVFDQFSYTDDQYTLTVFPAADFTLGGGQEILYACPYDTVMIFPTPNPESWSYLWSNGSAQDTILVGSTGLGYDSKTFTLYAETDDGCVSQQDITVVFDFGYCFGVKEDIDPVIRIYPNPGNGMLNVMQPEGSTWEIVEVYNMQAQRVYSTTLGWDHPSHNIILDLTFLSPGIYTLCLTSKGMRAASRLVIIP